jgi:hypothetical protein
MGFSMKKFGILTAILAVSTFAHAQRTAVSSSGGDSDIVGKRVGNVVVPSEKLSPITIPKTTLPIVIDGRPDEEAWKTAAVFKDFYQVRPGDNIAPSKPTEVRVLYDEKNLYVSFKCWDEREKIRATVAKRDDVFGDDNVRIWLDTYNDQRRAYVLGFNPLGIQQDGVLTEGAMEGPDFSVDIVMESKGVIEDWGWSVEAKIPFKSLRYSAGKGKLWGFNAARTITRLNNEFDQWLRRVGEARQDNRARRGQVRENSRDRSEHRLIRDRPSKAYDFDRRVGDAWKLRSDIQSDRPSRSGPFCQRGHKT